MKTVFESTTQYQNVFTEVSATCCVYQADLNVYAPPPFTNNFVNGVATLPLIYDSTNSTNKGLFRKFINVFGTHGGVSMNFGGIWLQRSTMNSSTYSNFKSSNYEIQASAQASGFMASGSTSGLTQEEIKQGNTFSELSYEQKIVTKGGEYSSNQTEWIPSTKLSPNPISATLIQLDQIVAELSTERASALEHALYEYCYDLGGDALTCDGFGPDPAFPSGSMFHGFYSQVHSSQDGSVNPYTNGFNCPVGYVSVLISTLDSVGHSSTINLFICQLEGVDEDPLHQLGGWYHMLHDQNTVPTTFSCIKSTSPATDCQCPSGFKAQKFLCSEKSEVKKYNNLFYCINETIPTADGYAFGGFYEHTPDGEPNVENQFAHTISCPDGFGAHLVAKTAAWATSTKTASTYICLSNVY